MKTIWNLVISMRPIQWSKNLFIFAPLIFSREFLISSLLWKVFFAFLIFCGISGSAYIINDLLDIENDRWHPRKSRRPLASGDLNRITALLVGIIICIIALGLAYLLNWNFFMVVLVYFAIQVAYSYKLKHIPILDVFVISAGFVLRVTAGGLVAGIALSDWILVCSSLLALFIALSKRRYEFVWLENDADKHRPILKEYSVILLDQMISVVTASTLIAYCLYTVSPETVSRFGTKNLLFTAPFVLYGIFRFFYLIHQKGQGGSPEELILKDLPLLIDILLWVGSVAVILYVF